MASQLGALGLGRQHHDQRVAKKAQAVADFGANPVLDTISPDAFDDQRGRSVRFCLAKTAQSVAHSETRQTRWWR